MDHVSGCILLLRSVIVRPLLHAEAREPIFRLAPLASAKQGFHTLEIVGPHQGWEGGSLKGQAAGMRIA